MENEKKQQLALIIGFISILLVILITLFRSDLFSAKKLPVEETFIQTDDSKASGLKSINAKELQKKITLPETKKNLVILDVRSYNDYIIDHIIDSVNLPLDEFPAAPTIDVRKKIYVIGANNDDENIVQAVEKLKDEDFEDVTILAGGMDSWKQLIGITVSYGNPKSFVDQAKVNYVDPEQIKEALISNVPMYILDIRSSLEFAKGHIAGAVNIPLDQLEKRRAEVSEKKVVIIGKTELEEFQASVQLYDMLLISPYVVRGGMPKWQEKGFPLAQ